MDNMKKILLIQLKRAGDVIVTTPVLPALATALPHAEIDFLTSPAFAPLLECNPYIRKIQIFSRESTWSTWQMLRRENYDLIVDFQSSPRSVLAGLWSGAPVRAGYDVSFWGKFLNKTISRPGSQMSVTDGKMSLLRSLIENLPQ